jgi:hypothetical protein
MIQFNAAPAFDFDEWASLHRSDPEAFEARRRALLAIEIARGGEHAPAAKLMVDRLEAKLEGCSDPERLQRSLRAMAASVSELTARWQQLTERLTDHTALLAARRDPKA